MRIVRDILQEKGSQVWAVTPETTVFDALDLMAEKNIGAVLVLAEGRLVGILSERDYARKVVLKGKASRDLPAGEIMSERVVGVEPHQTVEECMALMTDKRIRHLPVVEGGEVVGVVSIGDIVKAIISKQEFLIEQLEHYITGTPYRQP